MRVADIMTTPVIGVEPGTEVADAVNLMLGNRVSGLPVITSSRKLVGIVTEGDFLRRSELGTAKKRPRWIEFLQPSGKLAQEYTHAAGRKVADVMTADVATVPSSASLDDLVELMTSRRIKRMPVVDNGKLVGIVSRSDLMRAMLRARPASTPASQDDEAIRATLVEALKNQPWAGNGAIRAIVKDGAVELQGTVFDDHCRKAAAVVAENVSGVKSVVNHIAWMEPVSGTYIIWPGEDAE
ncbi:CBS domain-containing protein [Aestuariivirga sp.]|uniref:CBS domain-containing protein n=1 Tax=Aestuariivirga sp. TaxID=2650926 RepID=UPI0039E4FD53